MKEKFTWMLTPLRFIGGRYKNESEFPAPPDCQNKTTFYIVISSKHHQNRKTDSQKKKLSQLK